MESGLEGRNNAHGPGRRVARRYRLNGVRPRRPEQYTESPRPDGGPTSVSMESGLEGRNNFTLGRSILSTLMEVSMESGLEGRNNAQFQWLLDQRNRLSQWSPA